MSFTDFVGLLNRNFGNIALVVLLTPSMIVIMLSLAWALFCGKDELLTKIRAGREK